MARSESAGIVRDDGESWRVSGRALGLKNLEIEPQGNQKGIELLSR
jgi:hypothetical protein